MRTITNADDVVESLPRLSVRDGNSVWQNITNRLYSVSLQDDLGADSASVTLNLRNNPDLYVTGASNNNLDPLDVNSNFYINGEALLANYHEVKVEISKDGGLTYDIIFQGYAGPGTVTVSTDVKRDDTVTLAPCDLSFSYKECHFFDSLIYRSASATSIMSQIFVDHGFNQTVTVVDDPNFHVEEIRTGETSVWEAQKSIIEPTGYIYRIKWDTDAFKPCVYDPDRTNTTPDAIFNGTFQYRKLDISEADVRTKVVVMYRNRVSGTIEYAQSESESALNKYGIPDGSGGKIHKTMWLAMQGTGDRYSQIDTPEEAKILADYVLYDLKEPVPDIEIRIPRVHPGIEIHDLLSFVGDDYTVNVGVTGISWSWSVDNAFGETSVRGTTNRVIGSYNTWLAKDAHSQDVKQERQTAFLLGDGKPPDTPPKPTCLSYWGVDSDTGVDVPVVVCTIPRNQNWDLKDYKWSWQIYGETETETRITEDPRIVLKGLPVGKKVRVWVHARDWSLRGA